jgi:large subunit ribosomal protein LX
LIPTTKEGIFMKAYKVKGSFLMGDRWQQFTKEEVGNDESEVKEKVLSRLGSKHRVKRTRIQISEVLEIQPKEVTDPIIKYRLKSEKPAKRKGKEGGQNG